MRAGVYGNLSSVPVRQLTTAPQWQHYVLTELMESFYDKSSERASTSDMKHSIDLAFDALREMQEDNAREVEPNVLRMLLQLCNDALQSERLHVLEVCSDALQAHPDLLVTLQYHQGCRDAVSQLLEACVPDVSKDSRTFLRWLTVQRQLGVHTSERVVGGAHNSALEGLYISESVDAADFQISAEELLTA